MCWALPASALSLLLLAAVSACAAPARQAQQLDDQEAGLRWRVLGQPPPGLDVSLAPDPSRAGRHALAITLTGSLDGAPVRIERRLEQPVDLSRCQYLGLSVYVDSPGEALPRSAVAVEAQGFWKGVARLELPGARPRAWMPVLLSLMEMWDRNSVQACVVEVNPAAWRPGRKIRLLFRDFRATTGEPYDSLRRSAQSPAPFRAASFGSCVVYGDDSLSKVYADAPYPPKRVRSRGVLSISAARNEYEPAQLVFRSEADMADLRVVPTDLHCGSHALPAGRVRCQRVGYVAVDKASDQGGQTGLCPDILYEDDRFSLARDRNQSIWVTVYVPKDVPGGRYRGGLRVEHTGRVVAEIPLEVRVFGFTIPERVHCRTVFSLDRQQCEGRYGKWSFDLAKAYYRNLAEHRASPMGFWFVPDPHDLDFTEYDRHLALFKQHGFNTYCLAEPWLAPHAKPWNPVALPALRLETGAGPDDLVLYHRDAMPSSGWRWSDGWHHAALTWDGWTLSLLLDGKVVASQPESRPFAPYAGGRWHLGARSGTAEQPFRGWVDDFRLSDVARDPESIRASLGAPLVSDEHTRALVNFEGAAGRQVPDASGHIGAASANQTPRLEDGPFGRCAHVGNAEVISLPASPALDPAGWKQFTIEVRFRREGDPVAWCDIWSYWGDAPGTLEQNRRFLSAMLDHAQQEGVLDDTFLYVIDEPNFGGKMEVMARYCRELAEIDPRVAQHKMRLVTCMPSKENAGLVDIWCPVLQQWFPEQAAERQRAGDNVWWYVCCGPGYPYPNFFTDHPLLEPRILFWLQYRYNVEGFLYWALNWWGAPANDPFKKHLRIGDGVGDGMLLYPGADGPLNSLRWECIRDGIEDYEYHWLLADAVRQAEAQGRGSQPAVGAARRALRQADSFLVTHRDVSFLNAGHLRRARVCLAEALERLQSEAPAR